MDALRRARACLFLCALVLSARSDLHASEISARFEKIARDLAEGYLQGRSGTETASLAVLTFASSDSLSKRRVGFAASELLTHQLVKGRAFTVVERTQIEKVLSEQSFQLTGAVDAASAARIGRVLGADLLVLGSIERAGPAYGVNARLVKTETGEVLSTAYGELPAETFDTEARPYLVLVPERQALGLYLLYNYRHNSNRFGSFQSGNMFGGFFTVSPKSFSLGLVGGGVRYSPIRDWMVDTNVAVLAGIAEPADIQGNSPSSRNIDSGRLLLVRATLNWTGARYKSVRGILGAGLSGYRVLPYGTDFSSAVVPGIRGGIEYKPQERLGLGFLLNYDFLDRKGIDTGTRLPVVELSRFSIEPTLAVYF